MPETSQIETQSLVDLKQVHAVVLINYLRRHHVLALKAAARRIGRLTILVSTPMEGDRNWTPQWDGLDVIVQKNLTMTLNRSAGFEEKNYIHLPIDTMSQLRRLNPDIVFSYEMGMRSLLCGFSRVLRRETPLVLVGNMTESLEKNRGALRRAMRHFVRTRVDYCTFNGPSCRRYLNRIGFDESRMFHYPYSYDPEKCFSGEQTFSNDGVRRLLYCGSLSERKAIVPFVRSLADYCQNHPACNIILEIAGDGPNRETLGNISAPNLNLMMLGNCDPQQLRDCYRRADTVVFPSLGDEWGMVPIEAWASGLPVLGSLNAQSVETVCRDGENGWCYEPMDREAVAAAIDRALTVDPEQLQRMSHSARESIAGFSADRSADRFCGIVQHALEANLGAVPAKKVTEASAAQSQLQPARIRQDDPQRRQRSNSSPKLLASMSLDLDNKWSYLKSHGDSNWESLPSYLPRAVPRILRVLDDLDLKITFFVVGQDAVIEENKPALQMIADRGHEIGNHSFHHEPCLHLYSPDQLDNEFALTEAAIEGVVGRKLTGFRGPGFSISDQTLRLLVKRGYRYDCTTFPTVLAPLARAYYFMTGSFSRKQKQEREGLFGKFSDGFMPNAPYLWSDGEGTLMEIPVSTFPGCRVPIHSTYLHYLAGYSELAATAYWSTALGGFQLTGGSPSMLLHPLDFIGGDEEPDLSFFPAMGIDTRTKIRRMYKFLGMMRDRFEVLTMHRFAEVASDHKLTHRSIDLARSGVS